MGRLVHFYHFLYPENPHFIKFNENSAFLSMKEDKQNIESWDFLNIFF